MRIIYRDNIDVSIEFESENNSEKELLIDIYLKWIQSNSDEKEELLKQLTGS